MNTFACQIKSKVRMLHHARSPARENPFGILVTHSVLKFEEN